MTADQPDNEKCPCHRVPSRWIVFVGTLSLFVGLNLKTWYDSFDSGSVRFTYTGFPFTFYSDERPVFGEHLDKWLLLADIAIALGAAAGLTYLMRNGWRDFWHWLRNAGVEYEPPEEE